MMSQDLTEEETRIQKIQEGHHKTDGTHPGDEWEWVGCAGLDYREEIYDAFEEEYGIENALIVDKAFMCTPTRVATTGTFSIWVRKNSTNYKNSNDSRLEIYEEMYG
ncbi:hypothetical protein ACFL14_00870 [Patescibacteria group bacterium]